MTKTLVMAAKLISFKVNEFNNWWEKTGRCTDWPDVETAVYKFLRPIKKKYWKAVKWEEKPEGKFDVLLRSCPFARVGLSLTAGWRNAGLVFLRLTVTTNDRQLSLAGRWILSLALYFYDKKWKNFNRPMHGWISEWPCQEQAQGPRGQKGPWSTAFEWFFNVSP